MTTPSIPPYQSLIDHAFEKIANAIVRGEIEPGARIDEMAIARQLGISKRPLTEALKRLAGRGLLTEDAETGAFTSALGSEDKWELLDKRLQLECRAARLAASWITEHEVETLERLLAVQERSEGIRRGTGYYQGPGDEDFHFLIARASRDEAAIKGLCTDLYYPLRLLRYRSSTRPGRTPAAFAEHRAILAAIAAHDPAQAESLMRAHMETSRANVLNG